MRRLLAALAVAALAVAAAGAGVVMTSAPATAAGSKCVALVVDFTHTGGSVSSACVTVGTNASGSDVLVAGHHKVTFDPRYGNDFVCAIDGIPAGGCHATDNTHDWVYYHRAPGGTAWHLSQEGAGTYKPANASTEGWVYDNGDSPAPAPRDVPYTAICKSTPKSATPTTSPTASPTPTRTAAIVSSRARPKTAPVRRTPTAVPSSPAVAASTTSQPVRTLASPLAAVGSRRAHAMHRVPLGLVLAVIALGGLGAAAAVRLRRANRTRP